MAEESWHAARLIPTSGISGFEEQERRATSALLAVMEAVKEFNQVLLSPLSAPKGSVECFIEVPFKLADRDVRPDGLIRVTRGSKTWTALVEVKTGKNELQAAQLEAYLDVAREQGYDVLLTISNEIPPSASLHPTAVDKRKLKKVELHHFSWSHILSQAVIQKEHRGVADPDQAWILGELIRYLEHPKSGALDFEDMGADWVTVREAVAAGTLRSTDKSLADVIARFDGLLRFAALHLGRRLGTEVVHRVSRKEELDPTLRPAALRDSLVATGTMSGAIRIPNTVGDIHVTADLRASRVTCHIDLDAPESGKAKTRVNWVLRQLKDAPESLRIEAFAKNQRGPGATELLSIVRADPTVLIADPTKELRSFRIAASKPMGTKRGRGRGSFIDSLIDALDTFYQEVGEQLKPWAAAPPKLRDDPRLPDDVPAALVSTAISSQDEPQEEREEVVRRPVLAASEPPTVEVGSEVESIPQPDIDRPVDSTPWWMRPGTE